jgi:hypothetical protein
MELTVWPAPTETYTTIRLPFVKVIALVVAVLVLDPTTGTAATNAMTGLARTVTDRCTKCVRLPDVPVTVTVYVPTATELAAETVSVLVEPAATGLLLKTSENPDEEAAERETLPVKPLIGVMLTMDELVPPG